MSELDRAGEAIRAGKARRATTHLWNAMPSPVGATAETVGRLDALVEMATQIQAGDDSGAAEQAEKLLLRAADVRKELQRRGLTPGASAAQEAERRAAIERNAERAAKARLNAITGTRRQRDTSVTRSFEYSVLELEEAEAGARLNEAGSLGWELVNVLASTEGSARFFFKREVWTEVNSSGRARAVAPGFTAAGAATGGGGFFAAGYMESGPDLDADGDVDGGLFDSLTELFG